MYDNSLYFKRIAEKNSTILSDLGIEGKDFILGTIHRDNNTDQPDRLNAIFSALCTIADEHQIKIVLPLHPRTKELSVVDRSRCGDWHMDRLHHCISAICSAACV